MPGDVRFTAEERKLLGLANVPSKAKPKNVLAAKLKKKKKKKKEEKGPFKTFKEAIRSRTETRKR